MSMNESQQLIEALKAKKPLAAMLAPSFPIAFEYPEIITKLRNLGFNKVVEVSLGARETNKQLLQLMATNPKARFITSPCPSLVRLIRTRMPEYKKFLTPNVDSPMIATAKIVLKHWPNHQPVFIGPCIVKKLEAKEDVPELNILVITYVELKKIFEQFKISEPAESHDQFDIAAPGMTRTYALDGGLSHSAGLTSQVEKGAVKIVSGWANCQQAIKDFAKDEKTKLLDILFCEGGCINGPGINSTLNLEERKKKINDFWLTH